MTEYHRAKIKGETLPLVPMRERGNETMLCQIRNSSNSGMALGSDRFKQEIEALTWGRVTALKRGPKPKIIDNKWFLL